MTSEARRKLASLVESVPSNFYELAQISKDVINCWVDIGYDYPSPYIDEFISIDSQADMVRNQGDDLERAKFFLSFYGTFIKELECLKCFIENNSPKV